MTIDQLIGFLSQPRQICITTHTRPDGDAIGSSAALALLLRDMGHKAHLLLPNKAPAIFDFLPCYADVLCYDQQPDACLEALAQAELIFILDLNDYKRLEGLTLPIAQHTAPKILIYHHLGPQIEPDWAWCNPHISSTAELVYQFMGLIGRHPYLTPPIATCIYTGIATDTGRFKYNTQANTLAVVSELLRCGLDMQHVNGQIFDRQTESQLRLQGFCLYERMTILPQYQAAYIALSTDDLTRFNFEDGDLEGVVNMPLSIDGINVSVLLAERDDKIRLSLRSKGNLAINHIAQRYFAGGGHANAAGGTSYASLPDTIAQMAAALARLYEK